MSPKAKPAPKPTELVRISMKPADLLALVEVLEEADWQHPLRFKLHARYVEHTWKIR